MKVYRKPELIPLSALDTKLRDFKGLVRLEDGSVRAVYEISSKTNEKGEIQRRSNGSMISLETGTAFAYAIDKLQDRGRFFINPQDEVYAGQVVGEHVHDNDLVVNVTKAKQLTNKEEDTLKDMKLVQEMYDRGFDFVPIDIFRAEASRFQIIDGKLMPSLATIDGMGDKAAEAIVDAAKDGPFLSKDDFRQRTKVPKTVVDLMDDLHLLGDLPESNQLSLFDFA